MNFPALLNIIATLAVLLALGFFANKRGIIDDVATKKLSTLMLRIGQPALIISSLLKCEYSNADLIFGLKVLALGFFLHGIMGIFAFVSCRGFRDLDEQKISEFSLMFGNVGFVGFPILESLLGARGLFMGVFLNFSFNILMWTWGISILARKRKDIRLSLKKILFNVGTVSSVVALAIYVSRIPQPAFLVTTCNYLAGLCAPLSMLITGAVLARRSFKQIVTGTKVYYISFIKLLVLPMLVTVLLKLMGMSYEFIIFFAAVAAMPSASSICMYTELYDIKPSFAAHTVGVCSVLSVLTLPAVMLTVDYIARLGS